MTFRISKYTYNSYKVPAWDKNLANFHDGRKIISFWNVVAFLFIQVNFICGFMLHRKLVKENNLVKENFENRKIRQMAFDFMIYSQSTKTTQNSIDQISLY